MAEAVIPRPVKKHVKKKKKNYASIMPCNIILWPVAIMLFYYAGIFDAGLASSEELSVTPSHPQLFFNFLN